MDTNTHADTQIHRIDARKEREKERERERERETTSAETRVYLGQLTRTERMKHKSRN